MVFSIVLIVFKAILGCIHILILLPYPINITPPCVWKLTAIQNPNKILVMKAILVPDLVQTSPYS